MTGSRCSTPPGVLHVTPTPSQRESTPRGITSLLPDLLRKRQTTPLDLRQTLFSAMNIEPLLSESIKRYLWDMYKKAQASFWTVEEVDLAHDVSMWNHCLTADEHHFLTFVLTLFASSNAIHFSSKVQVAEARCFYSFQIMMENIHSELYSLLISTYVQDATERDTLFNAIDTLPCMKKKANWARHWIKNPDCSFGECLVAFAAVEGIFFSSSFTFIFWLKKRGLMPGLTFSNEVIAHDKAMHTDFACLLFQHLLHPPPTATINTIINDTITVKKAFFAGAPHHATWHQHHFMLQYIEFVANHLLNALGHAHYYHTANPFDFIDLISLQGKTNFFGKQVSDYMCSQSTHEL
ncbi:hypothetical protein V8D89_012369 [Ganoderma adspersum]